MLIKYGRKYTCLVRSENTAGSKIKKNTAEENIKSFAEFDFFKIIWVKEFINLTLWNFGRMIGFNVFIQQFIHRNRQ